jgi:hypothetical protein
MIAFSIAMAILVRLRAPSAGHQRSLTPEEFQGLQSDLASLSESGEEMVLRRNMSISVRSLRSWRDIHREQITAFLQASPLHIVALTTSQYPSSGPWKRVPSGNNNPAFSILGCNGPHDVYALVSSEAPGLGAVFGIAEMRLAKRGHDPNVVATLPTKTSYIPIRLRFDANGAWVLLAARRKNSATSQLQAWHLAKNGKLVNRGAPAPIRTVLGDGQIPSTPPAKRGVIWRLDDVSDDGRNAAYSDSESGEASTYDRVARSFSAVLRPEGQGRVRYRYVKRDLLASVVTANSAKTFRWDSRKNKWSQLGAFGILTMNASRTLALVQDLDSGSVKVMRWPPKNRPTQ